MKALLTNVERQQAVGLVLLKGKEAIDRYCLHETSVASPKRVEEIPNKRERLRVLFTWIIGLTDGFRLPIIVRFRYKPASTLGAQLVIIMSDSFHDEIEFIRQQGTPIPLFVIGHAIGTPSNPHILISDLDLEKGVAVDDLDGVLTAYFDGDKKTQPITMPSRVLFRVEDGFKP